MRSLRYGVVALAALGLMLFLSAARAAEVPALPQEIKPDNPGIRLIGRSDTRAAWSNSAVEIHFRGRQAFSSVLQEQHL